MKFLRLAAIVVVMSSSFVSCQKTSDFDGASEGTLKASISGDCSPIIVNGIFQVDSVLSNNQYIDVKVAVNIPGSFNIKSDTVNGFSFAKSGTISEGLNTIRLYASGKPLVTGVYSFTINYGTSSCSFDITVFDGTTSGGAFFTLGGSPGNCSVSAINGVYKTGQAMTVANTVEITVNVTNPGSYNIVGTVDNGVSFGGSGVFLNPGVQNIILPASGVPLGAGTFNLRITNMATTCEVPVTFL